MKRKPSVLCWNNGCWSAGAEKSAVVNKRPASLRWSLLGSVPQDQPTETVVREGQGRISLGKLKLAREKSLLRGPHPGDIKGS